VSRIENYTVAVDTEPPAAAGTDTTLPFMWACADDAPDDFNVRLYHCPIDPLEELRLTWDALRRKHAGFCKACRKLWPLPRRVLTAQELRAIADARQLHLGDQT